MKPWLAITRMLSILAIFGLVLAPFTVPAVAGGLVTPITASDTGMARASATYDMAMAEAQCCAPARSSKSEGPKACPLAALCHAKIVQGVSVATVVLRWFSPAQARAPGNDATPKTLAQAPPARPPQA
ncbi:hypothetical protein [Microvirga arsenatis]|uniref:Uncharacterized protein n=1 Tax=Microvirga arsenatis TaxID=2692265 RepID=A0ABW9YU27_9HYPH|nr:hypothetical protein [Microvirga arsenatis]NBJ09472.1 hypothetical protein [Microvirga arsenatis]NBJ23669.1 hypothetical protein [Microvirga arsenatis]